MTSPRRASRHIARSSPLFVMVLGGLLTLGGIPLHSAAGDPASAPAEGVLQISMDLGPGMLEPPTPREVTFEAATPAGVKAPLSLGTLQYAKLPIGGSEGGAGGTLAALGKLKDGPHLYYDFDGDGDLSNAGAGTLKTSGGFLVRWAGVEVNHPPTDPEPHVLVPLVFAGTTDDPAKWYVVENAVRRGELAFKGARYSVALVDGDFDGSYSEGGKDILWFDGNEDGRFDPAAGARERLNIPAIVKAGDRTYRLTLGCASGAVVIATPADGQTVTDTSPAPAASLLSYRLAFATASETAVEERVAAVQGAAKSKDRDTRDWLMPLLHDGMFDVRQAALEAVSDKDFGADDAAAAVEDIVKTSKEPKLRVRGLELLAGHPGTGVETFLLKFAEEKDKPLEERVQAIHSMGPFGEASDHDLKRQFETSDAVEVKAAAYEELAKRTPDDVTLHAKAMDCGSPGARAGAIVALARLKDMRGLVAARKEITNFRFREIRAACARALVGTGKKGDLELALQILDEVRTRSTPKGITAPTGPQPESEERKALREALTANRDRADVREWLLKKAIGHADVAVRMLAIDIAGDMADEEMWAAFLARLPPKETDPAVKVRLLRIAAAAKKPAEIPPLLKLANDPDDAIRDGASDALIATDLNDVRVKQFVLGLLASTRWPDHVQGAETAGKGPIPEAIPLLITNLAHPKSSVRVAAVEALHTMLAKDAVLPLIDLLERENKEGARSRVSIAVIEALRRITGQHLFEDPDFWRSWVSSHPDFKVPETEPDFTSPDKDRTVAPTFKGIRVDTNRMIFVVDQSNSMYLEDDSEGQFRTRWEVVQLDLINAIKRLPAKGSKFNVIFFSQNAAAYKPKMVDADASTKKDVERWIRSQTPEGETNVWDGLEMALKDDEVDTIFLLTDGQPTTGKYVSPADILQQTATLNRYRRIQVNTVSVGGDSRFLRDLAVQNHGHYVRK